MLGPDCGFSLRIAFTEDILYDHKWLAEDVLGLDHMDKSNKRTNGAYKNDAIVIKG